MASPISVLRESVDSLVASHASVARDVSIVSPWIRQAVIESLEPVLARKKLQILMLPHLYQRGRDVEAVQRLKNADVFAGLVHAKLYMFKNDDGSSSALFGS